MLVSIEPIGRDDLVPAVHLIEAGTLSTHVEHVERIDDYWEAVLETRRRRGEVLVARVENEVVGVCQVMVFPHFQHTGGWCCEVESVYVRDDWRSRGVGTRLLEAAEALARSRDCYRIQLTSRNVRLDAHRFYRRLGFEQTSQGFKKPLGD